MLKINNIYTNTNTNTNIILRSWAPKAEHISNEQDAVMAALWQWRDNTARNLDESIHYIMSNSELLRIGIIMPTTQSELIQCEPIMNDLVDKVIGKSTNSTNSTNFPNNIIYY